MAGKIQLTPGELQSQATEMQNLETEYSTLFAGVSSDLKSVNGNWSPNLSNNFEGKINSAQKSFTQITQELMNGSKVANTCAVTFESVDSELSKLYSGEINTINTKGFFDDYIADIIDEYIEIIKGDGSLREKTVDVIKWLKNQTKTIGGFKKIFEWAENVKVELPSYIKDGFDFIDLLDTGVKFTNGTYNYLSGLLSEGIDTAVEGAKDIFGGLSNVVSDIIKTGDMKFDFLSGIILEYGENMVSNWTSAITEETTSMGVYFKTFGKSFVDVFDSTVCNVPTLALAYAPAKEISSLFGFDLQEAYENVSDKTGFAAVTDTFDQMKDIFEENCNWDNWKSGMKYACDSIIKFFK